MGIRQFVSNLNALIFPGKQETAQAAPSPSEQLWRENYDAREAYFERAVGPLPPDILKMLHMAAVWPGGGLCVIPAPRLGPGMCLYTTFGLSNADMPTMYKMRDLSLQDEGGGGKRVSGTVEVREPAPRRPGFAGYGYEICMLAAENQSWPVNFLQWAVNAEMNQDVGFLQKVEQYQGLTIESILVAPGMHIHVLIAKAQAPLPDGCALPAGRMEMLAACVITEEEMRWSHQHGRDALLQKLQAAGLGYASTPGRKSVL
ncbi:suppressor of fused domain protein [Massilia sp. W12]|uniref:suppressor of fused domain protein n=1 Tax=Massilia sp. W12 TaxID=3126507 RepID=UPI0030D5FBB5